MFELGRRAHNPNEPLPASADAAAGESYRQAAHWAIRALDSSRASGGAGWRGLSEAQREKLASSPERLTELERVVEAGSFVELWELPKEERAHRAAELQRLARGLLEELSWKTRALDALWLQRLMRTGLLLVSVALLVFGVRFVLDGSERSRDVAAGKPWRISSSAPGLGCSSPLQECAGSSDFFFHTTEESSPWLELDLGKPTRFSGVRVINRRDCCFERAVPLLVEISNDGQNFKEVSRRTTSFSSWLATFSPTEARYVRVRAPSRTILHLSQIRVLR
jgi:hypothetical protein